MKKKKMKKNLIIATGVTGIYKDQDIEIEIGKHSNECHVKVNGKEVNDIFGVHIHLRAGELTTIVLEKFAGKGK